MRSTRVWGIVAGGLTALWVLPAVAQAVEAKTNGGGSFVDAIVARLEVAISHFPALISHLLRLPEIIASIQTALLLAGIVVAGLAAEYLVRLLLRGLQAGSFVGTSAIAGFARAAMLDAAALAALWVAGRLVLGQLGDRQGLHGQLGQQFQRVLATGWRL